MIYALQEKNVNTGFRVEDAAIRQADLGSNIGGYFDFKDNLILCITPLAFNGSHWGILRHFQKAVPCPNKRKPSAFIPQR